jgi:hypothetical protein
MTSSIVAPHQHLLHPPDELAWLCGRASREPRE